MEQICIAFAMTKKCVPTPGIEPGPPAWKAGILTTRPFGRRWERGVWESVASIRSDEGYLNFCALTNKQPKRKRPGPEWSCDGRVVKALDLKSNGIFPRRFEPCSQRNHFLGPIHIHSTITIFLSHLAQGVNIVMVLEKCIFNPSRFGILHWFLN